MKHSSFVHLHLHTMYSLLDGAIRLEHLMKRAVEFKMPAVAITDHGNMFGAMDFYLTAEKYGLKPIIGCEIYVAPGSRFEKKSGRDHDVGHHLVLLAKNRKGYRNLCQLVTKGYFEGFYFRPRVDKELLAQHHEGLIALSACLHGVVAVHLGRGEQEKAEAELAFYRDLFTDRRFYLELQDNGIAAQYPVNEQLISLARRFDVPLVATNDCHYLMADDALAHEVLLCIQTGKKMDDPGRMQYGTDQLYFKSPEEMSRSFADYPEAIANTVEIAERCNFKFEFGKYHPPNYVPPAGLSLSQYLEQESRRGLEERLPAIRDFYRGDFSAEREAKYRQRLESELAMINQMGFAGYFLIVADFVNYARRHGIPVGPGRGSAAGSLVAYALKITDIDPLPYGLLFERFLNPERISMPDIDMDFCIRGREQVINYVTEKYGADRVAQIITFGRMQAKAVIRDVGRALSMPYPEVDRIAKLVPGVLNITLEQAFKMEKRLRDLQQGTPEEQQLLKVSLALEGLNRHASIHAAGVVVANNPLVEYLPLYIGQNGEIVTQFDMNFVEKLGLIKFDFLGLKTLTVIDNTLELINRKAEYADNPFDLATIPLDDQQTYALLVAGNTTGVFQLESSGMQALMRRLNPSCFEDIIALVALYRPGPLNSGMIDDFIDRKHGRQAIEYSLPQLEPILKDTYGVIVYQEQVMQIAQALAGYTLGEADILRRAMGKKKKEEMDRQRQRFMEGARKNKIAEKLAGEIFDLMAKFAEYGFNKSHSAAYALIAYQTAYLKAHFPVEFMAALLMEDMHNSDKVIKNIAECKEMKIEVLPPDVNESSTSFTVVPEGIRFGLAAIKNVGEKAAEEIIRERQENGRYESIFAFCQRVDLQKVNKRVIESLIKSGAFDSTGVSRAKMLAVVEEAIEVGQRLMRDRQRGQLSLFELVGDDEGDAVLDQQYSYPDIEEWSGKTKLAYEKESLGFYITGHPLEQRQDELRRCGVVRISRLATFRDQSRVRIGGLVAAVKEKRTARGQLMGFVTLEDVSGTIEVTMFPDAFQQAQAYIDSQEPIIVEGRLEVDEDRQVAKVVANTVSDLGAATEKMVSRVVLSLNRQLVSAGQVRRLYEILDRYRGSCPGFIMLRMPACEAVLSLPENFRLQPSMELVAEVDGLFGCSVVDFQF